MMCIVQRHWLQLTCAVQEMVLAPVAGLYEMALSDAMVHARSGALVFLSVTTVSATEGEKYVPAATSNKHHEAGCAQQNMYQPLSYSTDLTCNDNDTIGLRCTASHGDC